MQVTRSGAVDSNVRSTWLRYLEGWPAWRGLVAIALVLGTSLAGMLLVQYWRLHDAEAGRLTRLAGSVAEIVGKRLAVAERQLLTVAEVCRQARPSCGDTGTSILSGVPGLGEDSRFTSSGDWGGRLRFAGRREIVGRDRPATDAFRRALQQDGRRSVLWADDTTESAFAVARAIADSRGEIVGIAAVDQTGEDLRERLDPLRYAADVRLVVGEVGGRTIVSVPAHDEQGLAALLARAHSPGDSAAETVVLLPGGLDDSGNEDTWAAVRAVPLGTIVGVRPLAVGVVRSRSAIDAPWWGDVLVAGVLLIVVSLASALSWACHRCWQRRNVSRGTEAEAIARGVREHLSSGERLALLGAMAGGVAHDFNNLLVAVLGFSGLGKVMARAPGGSERIFGYFQEIETAGERARSLVRQILAISRGGEPSPVLVPVSEVVQEVIDGLAPTFPDRTSLSASGAESLPLLAIERGHLHRLLTNACRNARDALGESGSVRIVARSVRVDPAMVCASCGVKFAGDFVRLAVIDEGHGIPAEIRDRVFEPFFTTRRAASGSGTGLTVVHGLLHYYGGHVQLASTPGCGSELAMLLPLPPGSVDGPR